jgi:hypothetical protein
MVDKKLSQLPTIPTSVSTTDYIYVVRDGLSYKATAGLLGGLIVPSGQVTSVGLITDSNLIGSVNNPTTSPTISLALASTAVSAGTYGTITAIPSFTVDGFGRIVAASETSVNIGSGTVTSIGVLTSTGISANVTNPNGDARITIALTPSGVSAGTYGSGTEVGSFTLDTYGRVTSATRTSITYPSAVTSIGVSLTDLTGSVTNPTGDARINLALTSTGVSAGTYGTATVVPQLTLDGKGRVTSATRVSVGPFLTSLGVVTSVGISATVTNPNGDARLSLALTPSGVVAGSYGSATVVAVPVIDAYGRITSVSNVSIAVGGTGTVTSVGVSTSTGITATVTNPTTDVRINLNLTASGVTPAAYGSGTTVPRITVDTYGRVTAVTSTSITYPTAVTSVGVSLTDLTGSVTNPTGDARINLALTSTGVSAGVYGDTSTVGSFTIDGKGRVTGATRQAISLTSVTGFISGFIPTVANGLVTLCNSAPFAFTVKETITKCSAGTASASFRINGTAIGGGPNAISTTLTSVTRTTSNSVAIGNRLEMEVSSNTSCFDMSFTVVYNRSIP